MKRTKAVILLLLLTVMIAAGIILHPQKTVTILMYHHLVRDGGETNSLTVTEGKFRRDMDWLAEHGYVTLGPAEAAEVLQGSARCPKSAVVISFDDGYQSNYEIAYPILREHGFQAVIALITANIHEEPTETAFMLTWPEVREMSESGYISFGSHTDNLHNPDIGGALRKGVGASNGVERLTGESRAEYEARVGADIGRSCELIESHTGQPVLWFAYPYGACDSWCNQILDGLGVTISVSTEPGRARPRRGTRDLPRYGIREETELSAVLA